MADFDENDPGLAKHFEMAGIEPDKPAEVDPNAQPATEEKPNEEQSNQLDLEGKSDPKQEEKKAEPNSNEPAPADANSNGNGTDAGKQPGKEDKGKEPRGPQDLTLADGTVVKGGNERRFYEQRELARREAQSANDKYTHAQAQLAEAQAKVQAYEAATQQVNGLPPEQVAGAVRLYRDLAASPVATVQKLLAELKAQGHNIDGIGANVDTAAISRMIDQRLNTTEQNREPTHDPIAKEVTEFFGKYPDAVQHEETLARVIEKFPHLTFEQAYFQLRSSVIDAGLDWSKSLTEQVASRQTQQQPTIDPSAPRTNGRPAAATAVVERVDPFAPEGDTTDDIVRAAMREAGLKA